MYWHRVPIYIGFTLVSPCKCDNVIFSDHHSNFGFASLMYPTLLNITQPRFILPCAHSWQTWARQVGCGSPSSAAVVAPSMRMKSSSCREEPEQSENAENWCYELLTFFSLETSQWHPNLSSKSLVAPSHQGKHGSSSESIHRYQPKAWPKLHGSWLGKGNPWRLGTGEIPPGIPQNVGILVLESGPYGSVWRGRLWDMASKHPSQHRQFL